MTDKIKKNKNQHNDAIEYEPKFDNKFSLSSGTKDPLLLITVSLRGYKKQKAKIRDIGDTKIVINRRHTKPYDRKMRSNNVEYSTDAGLYCTTHDVKVPFCMPEFYSSTIISHHFHVDSNEG